ncbi:NAD(P)-binding protein [Venturia nashicola]|uniref:NAD(P)-binding protein n=1 Tax=Venturia nashicola TaxID=86259 RepID=A0A4Z1PHC6_9PEZI|nr:NAD(P)-binding protein [Venturia nashicola]
MASGSLKSSSELDVGRLFGVEGVVGVVTGGGSGIGLMLAKALAHNKAKRVYIIGRRKEKLDEAVEQIGREGVVVPLVGDITDQESLKKMADVVREREGYIDVLIPNAGIMGPKIKELSADCSIEEFVNLAWKTPMADFTDTYNVNITGVYYTILAFLALLDKGNKQERKWNPEVMSQVVVVGSIAAFSRMKGASFAYNSSKAGVTHLSKHLSTYFGRWEIRVNVIAPGLYPSEMVAPISDDDSKVGSISANVIPATRKGTEMDMAGVILSLVSRAGAYYNGSVFVTDGGRLGILPSSY